MKKIILDEDLKYINSKVNLLRSKTELSFSKLLSFLEKDYEYNLTTKVFDGKKDLIEFKLGNKYVEITNTLNDFFIIFVNQRTVLKCFFSSNYDFRRYFKRQCYFSNDMLS